MGADRTIAVDGSPVTTQVRNASQDEMPITGPLTARGISIVLPAYHEEAVIATTVTRRVAVC